MLKYFLNSVVVLSTYILIICYYRIVRFMRVKFSFCVYIYIYIYIYWLCTALPMSGLGSNSIFNCISGMFHLISSTKSHSLLLCTVFVNCFDHIILNISYSDIFFIHISHISTCNLGFIYLSLSYFSYRNWPP